jgi:hypothetical protein
MKTISMRFLSAFFGLAALAAGTRAQAVDKIIVNISHEFVVAGTTLPAGRYTINRTNDFNATELEIFSYENHTGVLVFSSEMSPTREFKPAVTFEQIGDQQFLSKIETADHIFTIRVPKNAAAVVAKNQTSPSKSSSSGSN